jgi:hypothetical protein
MSADNDGGPDELIMGKQAVVDYVQQNLDVLQNEISQVQGPSGVTLTETVDRILNPLAEAVASAEGDAHVHGRATAYLFAVRLFVVPKLRKPRRGRVERACDELAVKVEEFLRITMPLPPEHERIVTALVRGLEPAQRHLGVRLDRIGDQICHLNDAVQSVAGTPGQSNPASLSGISDQLEALNTTFTTPGVGPTASLCSISNQLGHIITTLTALTTGLIGPIPAPRGATSSDGATSTGGAAAGATASGTGAAALAAAGTPTPDTPTAASGGQTTAAKPADAGVPIAFGASERSDTDTRMPDAEKTAAVTAPA